MKGGETFGGRQDGSENSDNGGDDGGV